MTPRLTQIEAERSQNPEDLHGQSEGDVVNGTYGASPKIWQNKADFDSKVPQVEKTIADVKGSIKDLDSLKVAFKTMTNSCNGCHETYRVKLK